MQILRGNVYSEFHGAPPWWWASLERHLSVPVETIRRDENKQLSAGDRFGFVYYDREATQYRGSLTFRNPHRIPAGLTTRAVQFARQYNLRGELRDVRRKPDDRVPLWMVRAPWRPYQDEAHEAFIRCRTGVINSPPRSGKTLMASRIIDTLNTPTLYIAPSVQIVAQTYRVFVSHFGSDLVARLDGDANASERDVSKMIVVATAASAVRLPVEWYANRELLIIDEFHHAAAESYHQIGAKAVNAYHRIGLTGTHFRSGDDALAMEAICANCIYKIEISSLVAGGYIAAPRVVFAPSNAKRILIKEEDVDGKKKQIWPEAYRLGIVENEARNARVIGIARMLSYENGIPTIVLVNRRDHADVLGAEIPNAIVVKGGENAQTSAGVKSFNEGRYDVLVGTSVIGEGVDLPRAAALIYAGGGDATVGMMQSYYRPLTASPGKTTGLIYDFVDSQHGILKRHSMARIDFAKEQLPGCVVTL